MKARLTSVGIPDSFRKDANRIFRDWEVRYRDIVLERFIMAMLLTLSDLFGFGVKRMNRVLNAFGEIVGGYNEEAYDGIDQRLQSMDTMNGLLRDELNGRGIVVRVEHGCIVISTGRKE